MPDNGLILPSVSTAKCGDTIRFKCPPGVKHGLFKMNACECCWLLAGRRIAACRHCMQACRSPHACCHARVPHPRTADDGSCPSDFAQPHAGVELAPPEQSCDFLLELKDEPDYFVTSHAGGDCNNNLKMNIHSVCIQGATSASAVMGSNTPIGGGTSNRMRRAAPRGNDKPEPAIGGAAAVDGIGRLEAGSLQDHMQQQHRLAQQSGSSSAATRPAHLRVSNSASAARYSSRSALLAAAAVSAGSVAAAALLVL